MTIPRRPTRAFALLGLLACIGSCAETITPPPRQLASPLVLSDAAPNVATISASVGKAPTVLLAAAAAATETDVAYISLGPATYPNGVTAVIRNTRLDATVTAPMVDGGLDPIPVPATEGDTVEIEVLSATGVSLATVSDRVPRKRRPAVVRTVPPRGKTEVALNGRIIVVFSEPVDEATLSSSSVQLFRGDNAVTGTVRLLQGVTATAVFEPSADLAANTEYRLVVTEAVRDLDGDAPEATAIVEFTTGTTREGPVVSVVVMPDFVRTAVGSQFQLVATARDAQGTVITGRPIAWSTSEVRIATVSPTGLVTAVGNGVFGASITAEIDGHVGGANVFVSDTLVPIGSVIVSADSVSVTPGATLELIAETRDAEGNLVEFRAISWASSDPAVATVTPTATDRAVVNGVANGVVRIVATSEGMSDTTVVTVGPPPPVVGVIISPDTGTFLLRDRAPLAVSSRNAAGGRAALAGTQVAWESSDPAVAAVDGAGLVTAVGTGAATITATWNGFTATARLRVVQVGFSALSAGRLHTCAVTSSGSTYCWGASDFGQAGRPGIVGANPLAPPLRIRLPSPLPVTGELTFVDVSAGGLHTCGLASGGAAYCWGYNGEGALGNGTLLNSSRPAAVAGELRFVALSGGESHTCALTAAGDAYCWGSNRSGALGNGGSARSLVPMAVAGGHTFRAVSAGDSHTCALTTDGLAYCWGTNGAGQLGVGNEITASDVPLPVVGALRFAELSAGDGFTCGVTIDGTAYCWGWNFDGQLGNGAPPTPNATPVALSGGLSISTISSGRLHNCAIEAGGAAYCWGQSLNGRLGNGTTAAGIFATPQRVAGGLAFTRASAGGGHTCALATDTAWYCWGDNAAGALGAGTTTTSAVPVKVLGQP